MTWVSTILTVLAVLTGMLMTFLILLQEGKGGGLAALGGTKAAGVEGVTNPIRRATAYLAVIFFVLLISLAAYNRPEKSLANFGSGTPSAGAASEKKEEPKATDGAVKVEEPKKDVPAEAPKTEAPKTDTLKTETPKDAPKTEAPKADAPSTPAAPKAEEKKPEATK